MAAVLATGAVLSHVSAAAAWELRPAGAGAIHVTVPGDPGRARRAGIRPTAAPRSPRTTRQLTAGSRSPRPIRTVIDLATTFNGRPLEHALDLAEQRGLVDFAELRKAIEAHPTRPGSPSLQAKLSRYTAGRPHRSELEERFLALCDDHGLPRPNVNTRIEGTEVDFVGGTAGSIVEVDGYTSTAHRAPSRTIRARRGAHGGGLGRAALHLGANHRPPGMGRSGDSAALGELTST